LGLKFSGDLKQLSNFSPVNGPLFIDELLMLMKISSVVVKKGIHVGVAQFEAEFNRQKVITNESHQ